MNITVDLPLVLLSIKSEDTYDGDFKERRALIWTLEFTLKGYFYGPTANSGIIKFAETNLYNSTNATSYASTILSEPGLLANGQPTSNVSLSIAQNLIKATDNYGYITIISEKQ